MKVRVLHIILLLLVGCEIVFSADGFDFEIIESTDQHLVVDVRFDSISFIQKMQDGLWATDVIMPGTGLIAIPGEYRLPMVSLMLGIPAGSRPALTLLSENNQTKNIGRVTREENVAETSMSLSLAPFDVWQPNAFIKVGLDAIVRDQRVVQIQLFPVRYQPNTQLAQIAKSLRFRLDFGANAAQVSMNNVAEDKFESVYKSLIANYEISKKWRQSQAPEASLQKAGFAGEQQIKLYLRADGIYAVTGRDLAEAGIDLTSIYPRTLSLSNNGQAIPIIVEGNSDGVFDIDDRIVFLGSHNQGDNSFLSFYSDANVYHLSWGGTPGFVFSQMLAAPNGNETDTLDYAVNMIHFEQDRRYERLVGYSNGEDDHWFWDKMMDNQAFSSNVTLPGLTSESTLMLSAKFHGLTQSADVELNHHVVASINDQIVGDGYGADKKQFSLRSARFKLDVNQPQQKVKFELPLDIPDVVIDHAFLNWFEIEYDRSLRAVDDQLVFQAEPGENKLWRAGGFSTDQVYILTDNNYRLVNAKVNSESQGYKFEFVYNSSHASKVYMATENKLRKVDRIEMDTPSDLKNHGNRADYIIITHSAFQESAQCLTDYRNDNGLVTMLVDIQDVYDEFSDGVYDPRAIKRLVAHAYKNWQKPAPVYILLFGDTTYLMDKDAGKDATFKSYIPSFMVNTKSYGMTSSDNYFAAVSGNDALPDLHIGRLPANNTNQAEAMVDKIISYETKDVAAEWRRHIALAAGNGEFFDYSAQYLTDHYLPKWLSTNRLSTEFQSPHFNTTENFVRWINDGQNIINFLVHGSGEQIADANLLNKDDIIRLVNKDKYAFAVTMSCYIGHFDNPETDALGEALLVARDKGVMGLFGSSGKSYSYADFYFNGAVFNGIFQENWRALGEITTNAKYRLIEKTQGYWEPVDNFLLLGDPATKLQLPQQDINLTLSKKVLAEGDVLSVSGQLPQSQPGNLLLAVLSEKDSVLVEKHVEMYNDHFTTEMMTMTPEMRQKWGSQGGEGRVQAYFSDGQYHAVGLSSFSVVRPLISAFSMAPESPVGFEPFYFLTEIASGVAAEVGGIQSLLIRWTTDNRNWNDLPMSRQDDNSWKTSQTLSFEEGTAIWYKMIVTAGNGAVTEMQSHEYKVLYKPDVYWSTDVRYSSDPALLLTIKNRGESAAKNVAIKVVNKTTGAVMADGLQLAHIEARRDTLLRLQTAALPAGSYELELVLDPQNVLVEEEEENNFLTKMLHVVTAEQGSNGDFVYSTQNITATIPAGAIAQATSVELTTIEDKKMMNGASGASLQLLPLKGQAMPSLYGFLCSDSAMTLQSSPKISLNLDVTDSLTAYYQALNGIRIYAWDAQSEIWKAQETTQAGDLLSAFLPAQSMVFALMGSSDDEPPHVQISIPGQHFADGDVVPSKPVFTVAIEDAGGIDVSPENLIFTLDDSPLQASDYVMVFDPQKSGDVKVTYNSDLEQGEHSFQVNARDVNGNSASQQIQFRIAEEFGLDFIANHPNPFQHETTFAFQISDMASSVKLNIYTVSGRMIRNFEFTDITGYNEVDWDGADSDGAEIANGVYYLKFVARNGEEKIERIERLAKLK
jgi:hypothetical protein